MGDQAWDDSVDVLNSTGCASTSAGASPTTNAASEVERGNNLERNLSTSEGATDIPGS